MTNALVAVKKNNPNGIILDLRSNGGGILQEAVKIVNLFVAKDVRGGFAKRKDQRKKTLLITPPVRRLSLICRWLYWLTAIRLRHLKLLPAQLQDLDRAIIIGQRSYGKGLVQQTFNLPYNSLVKITIAKYYVPSGRCIQEIDYTHRKDDGSVVKVADSLIHGV